MKNINNENGFTMLEVMVAMIILTLSLLLLLNMSMVALDGNDWANKTTIATQVIQQKMEELRSNPSLMANGTDSLQGVFREWKITTEDKFLKRVDIFVKWEDIKKKSHTDQIVGFVRTDSI